MTTDHEAADADVREGVTLLQLFTVMAPLQRIATVRDGLPAATVDILAEMLHLSKRQLTAGLGLPLATVNRQIRTGARLNSSASEAVLQIAEIFYRVQRSLSGSDAEAQGFQVGPWLGTWLTTPNAALGEIQPLSLLDTVDGRMLVGDLLGSMEAGTYW